MKVWNFGIVGAGLIADFHARAIADIPNAKLVAVCDVVKEKVDEFAKKHSCSPFLDYQEMIDKGNVDILTIATPSGFHMEPTVAAAKAGKHVICEKPLDIQLDRIDAMIDAHEKAGTLLGTIYPSRFADIMTPIRSAINEGRFGQITFACAYVPWWRTDEYYNDSWHGTWKLDGGGALMNQSIHTIDNICDLMPDVKQVQALTATLAHPQIETEDTAVAVLRFANNALGIVYGATSSFPGRARWFEISGTKGTVVALEKTFQVWEFEDKKPEDEEIRKEFCKPAIAEGAADPAAIQHIGHTKNFEAFLKSLDSGSKLELDGKEGRKSVAVIRAIYDAAKQGKAVNL